MKTSLLSLNILITIYLSLSTALAQGPKNALRFDGFDDYIFFDYNNRGITNEVTVEAWVKTKATKLQLITAKYDRDAELGYQLVMRDGKAAFSGRDGSGLYRISGYSPRIINDDQWHHLAGVCKNGTWSIYIDGVLESESVTGYNSVNLASNAPFTVGNYYLVNNDFYQGQVDELKVWKKGLTESEIRAGMCQKANNTDPNLVVYLKFDEGSGSTVRDYSSYAINGTFRNMSPSTSWTVSGAPVGDQSIYRYDTKWDHSLEMVTDIATFSVFRADPAIKGFHIYQIATPPAQTGGLPKSEAIKEYYGVFKVGAPDKKYKIWFKQYSLTCGGKLYNRADNTSNTWLPVADTTNSPVMISHTTKNYGEYAAVGNSNSSITISGPNSICPGSSAILSVEQSNGTVLWSTGATTNSIQVSQGGTYTVEVTENGCKRSGNITIQESTPINFSLGPDKSLCFSESIELSAPAGFVYRWSTGAISRTIEVSASGTYWVEVTNAQGCIARDEINVTVLPAPSLTLPSKILACPNSEVLLDASIPGASYLWSNGQKSPSVLVTAPSDLSVIITLKGCSYTHYVSVRVDNTYQPKIQTTGSFCTGFSTTLSIDTDESVLWSTGEKSKTITVNKPGEYSVTFNQKGCTYTDRVFISESPSPVVDLGPDRTLCSGEQTTLEAPAGSYTYRWSTGATSRVIEAKTSGKYWVEVTNTNGCTTRDEVTVTVKPQPDFTLPLQLNACYGERINVDALTPDATYLWSTGHTSPMVVVTAPTKLSVAITVNGCTYTREVNVISEECPVIPNVITPNGDGKNDTFVLQGINIDQVEIEIFNRWGVSVYKRNSYDNKWSGPGSGMYYYHIKSGQTQQVYKGWVEVVR